MIPFSILFAWFYWRLAHAEKEQNAIFCHTLCLFYKRLNMLAWRHLGSLGMECTAWPMGDWESNVDQFCDNMSSIIVFSAVLSVEILGRAS